MAFSKLGNIKVAALLASFCMADESISTWSSLPYTNSAYQPYQLLFEKPTEIQGIEVSLAPELLDIALLVSVDGNIHARNRTSGEALWTLSPSPESDDPDLLATALSPLIRIERIANDTLFNADSPKIAYALEPQSGVIFELSVSDNGTTTPSQRLVYSVPELAGLSPFLVHAGDQVLVLNGRKGVRLLAIDLETGYLEDVVDANSIFGLTERTGYNRRSWLFGEETEGDSFASTVVLLERTGKFDPGCSRAAIDTEFQITSSPWFPRTLSAYQEEVRKISTSQPMVHTLRIVPYRQITDVHLTTCTYNHYPTARLCVFRFRSQEIAHSIRLRNLCGSGVLARHPIVLCEYNKKRRQC